MTTPVFYSIQPGPTQSRRTRAMYPYLYEISPRAQELVQNAKKHPDHLCMYLSTLEAENARLADATANYTARNAELNDIIERASKDYVHGRSNKEKHFTDGLLRRIDRLENENRNLRYSQYFNFLPKSENKAPQDGQKCQTELEMNQGEKIDREYAQSSGVSHEYGVNDPTLRNESSEHNLEIARKPEEVEIAFSEPEFESRIRELIKANGSPVAYLEPEVPNREEGENLLPSQGELHAKLHERCTDINGYILNPEARPLHPKDQCAQGVVHEKFLPLLSPKIDTFNPPSENEQVRAKLNAIQDISTELAHTKAQNHHLQFQLAALSSQFSQASSSIKQTFTSCFEKAISTIWSRFGTLQLNMDDPIIETADAETVARITKFSQRVRECGQRPLLTLQQDVYGLVEKTCDHFREIQGSLDSISTHHLDYKESGGNGDIEDATNRADTEHHSLTYFRCSRTGDDKLYGTANGEIEVGEQGTNAKHHDSKCFHCLHLGNLDSSLYDDANCGRSDIESETSQTAVTGFKTSHDADRVYNEAAQGESAWLERTFPKRRNVSAIDVVEVGFLE
ncbi:hypothetical protein VTL71DRAFT_1400 [Oculimacula yallundae]|uniref:Uncharacterized protein n=1 Tax=Oculimacula yallundae TaxID=86028 RepID=A0ABR4CCH6_9HELO